MRGIDISSWQGSVDFNKVKADGIEFCILREGFRKTIDSRFKEYVSGCKSAGIPILGCYHFIYWNGATIKENAVSMLNNMRLAGLDPFDTWLFADLEYDSWTKAGETVSKSRCTSLTKEFLDTLKELGCNKLAIYCNQDYYRNYLDWNVLSDYRDNLWLADYEGEPGYKCSIQQTGSTGKVNGISGNVDSDTLFDKSMVKGVDKMTGREAVVKQAQAWLGCNEADGSFKKIIDTYNNYKPWEHQSTCRRCNMLYEWHWCQCFVSAVFIKAGYASICPLEISCFYAVEAAKKMGIWVENDGYIPSPGDIIEYDWQDSGVGENYGAPDHTGIVEVVNKSAGTITLIEGNCSEMVKRRTIAINGRYIRGWIVPKYPDSSAEPKVLSEAEVKKIAKEVWEGKWGNGIDRKNRLEASGYNYAVIQAVVNSMAKDYEEPVEEVKKTYTVKKGDTMWKIAKENGLTLEELILKNPQVKNPNLIYVGDIINL